MCHCHPLALCRKRRYKRIWRRLWLVYKWGPRALPCSYGFGTLSSMPALTWCTGVTLGQAAEETASWESWKKSHWGFPGDFFELWHSFFVLSWAVTAMPMPHHASLLWRSWSWLPDLTSDLPHHHDLSSSHGDVLTLVATTRPALLHCLAAVGLGLLWRTLPLLTVPWLLATSWKEGIKKPFTNHCYCTTPSGKGIVSNC